MVGPVLIADTASCGQKNEYPLDRQISGNIGREPLVADTDSHLNAG